MQQVTQTYSMDVEIRNCHEGLGFKKRAFKKLKDKGPYADLESKGGAFMGIKKLTPPEKAATVLLALGEEGAAAVLRSMPEQDKIRALRALSRLGRVDKETANAALREFNEKIKQGSQSLEGSGDLAKKLLSRALPNVAQDLLDDLVYEGDGATELMEILQDIEPKLLATFLAKEAPQQIAVVLAHMDSMRGASCLKLLPETLRLMALQKLANLGSVEPGALGDLTETLRELARRPAALGVPIKGGLEKIAAIVNALDPASGQSLLAALGEKDRGLADAVEELLFQFSDLASLPDKSLVEVLKSVPVETLKLALRTAPELVSQALFRNLSERAQAMLRDDIAAMGLVRLADVEKAQDQIANIARRLIDEGKITGPKDRGDYV